MIDRLEAIVQRYRKIQEELARPEVVSDHQKLAALGRELRSLEPLVDTYGHYREAQDELAEAREMLRGEKDPQMQEYLRGEEHGAAQKLVDL